MDDYLRRARRAALLIHLHHIFEAAQSRSFKPPVRDQYVLDFDCDVNIKRWVRRSAWPLRYEARMRTNNTFAKKSNRGGIPKISSDGVRSISGGSK